jgi:hypothetical protein
MNQMATNFLYQTAKNYTKRPWTIPNGHKTHQHCLFQGLTKFTQIGIFGIKINHLATPVIFTNMK